ncbi:MAG: capsule biosynthesis protein CapA [Rhodobacteraceae bacterium]|jgi:capsular polysaccharide export protein|nr:capsule biosynthesis protein CapA [Paracoccaceae bacterium]
MMDIDQRSFLFLQGPHGPFFNRLAHMLRTAGAATWRVGFNQGDRAFWFHAPTYIPFRAPPEDWPDTCRALIAEKAVTDIVLYGDTRPIHAQAIAAARQAGITVHVFEEGYLRPYWVTYERMGSNGNSRLMQMSIDSMRRALAQSDIRQTDAPGHWGDMRQHVFYGALYHWFVLTRRRAYPAYRPHRALPVSREFRLYLRRLLFMPAHRLERALASFRVRNGGFPYHLVLLQLEHDASFQMHGPFATMSEFLTLCIESFARGALPHHHLVFKAHPLEDGRVPVRARIRQLAQAHGVLHRVHFVRGGKLAPLLDQARSAVTVNSTAGQQVLWRGLPLCALGQAVYAKPELVSHQPLAEFFARPARPDTRAYRDYRHYLLETSQVAGGFYSLRGRQQLMRQVVDMMLAPQDPYDALSSGNAAPRQQLQVVR